jgi:hypothetical protein
MACQTLARDCGTESSTLLRVLDLRHPGWWTLVALCSRLTFQRPADRLP